MHHLADAREYGYGQALYWCLVDENARIHCCLVIGNYRVAPLKYIPILRMETVAATLSLKISALAKKEFFFNWDSLHTRLKSHYEA